LLGGYAGELGGQLLCVGERRDKRRDANVYYFFKGVSCKTEYDDNAAFVIAVRTGNGIGATQDRETIRSPWKPRRLSQAGTWAAG